MSAEMARRATAHEREEGEDGGGRVNRFVASGGAVLEGRVVGADSGKPIANTAVEGRLSGRFIEVVTDASGQFRMPGMVPGSKVVVWVGGRHDPVVSERIEVAIPGEGQTADLGTIRLLNGDELAPRLDGWVGMNVARRSGQVKVSAVNPWLPADRSHVEVGDIVLAVGGRDVRGLGSRAVNFLLRGPTGSSVSVELEVREGKRRRLVLDRVSR